MITDIVKSERDCTMEDKEQTCSHVRRTLQEEEKVWSQGIVTIVLSLA